MNDDVQNVEMRWLRELVMGTIGESHSIVLLQSQAHHIIPIRYGRRLIVYCFIRRLLMSRSSEKATALHTRVLQFMSLKCDTTSSLVLFSSSVALEYITGPILAPLPACQVIIILLQGRAVIAYCQSYYYILYVYMRNYIYKMPKNETVKDSH